MRDFTALGGTAVLAAVALAVVGFLALTGKRHAAAAVARRRWWAASCSPTR